MNEFFLFINCEFHEREKERKLTYRIFIQIEFKDYVSYFYKNDTK